MFNFKKEKRWYIVQVFSNFEYKAVKFLRNHIKLHNLFDDFGDILIPTEKVVEIKGGMKRKSNRRFFPGYFLIHMIMNEKNWYLVRSIPKIMGFLGDNMENPSPIDDREVKIIKNKLHQIDGKLKPKVLFEPGELIRVNSGPFSDFNGVVEEVDYDKNRLKVSVSIFGRSAPVELDFSQVEKG